MAFSRATVKEVGNLIGLSGLSGSGKTLSALMMATGLSGGKPFAFLGTENERESEYAGDFTFDAQQISPPFRPSAYIDGIKSAEKEGYRVLVIDSISHMWDGEGGMMQWHDEIAEAMAARWKESPDKYNWPAWNKPKADYRLFRNTLLASRMYVILCMRAARQSEMKTVIDKGKRKQEIVPKETLAGFKGINPVCPTDLPFELMISLLLMPDRPGVPIPIKVPYTRSKLIDTSKPISVETGQIMAKFAKSRKQPEPGSGKVPAEGEAHETRASESEAPGSGCRECEQFGPAECSVHAGGEMEPKLDAAIERAINERVAKLVESSQGPAREVLERKARASLDDGVEITRIVEGIRRWSPGG